MALLFPNAYINVADMDGNIKYTNKHVQIDDRKPLEQSYMDRIPLVDKTIYDQPSLNYTPLAYTRGDVVTIVSMDGFALSPIDNIFWVERAIPVGPPLPAWEVGICGGRVTNATINTFRINGRTQVLTSIQNALRVTYIPPMANRIAAFGDVLYPVVLIDPWADVIEGDIFTVTRIDGLSRIDTKTSYTCSMVARYPTPVPHIHVRISGSLN